MSIHTKIPYCDSTVNPVVGCRGCELHSAASPEKSTCYAAALTGRWVGKPGWPTSFDSPKHFPDRITRAVRWADMTGAERPDKPWLNGYPRIIFVNDLSDGFNSIAPEIWLTPHLQAMASSPHIWLLSTKRPDVMARYFGKHEAPSNFWLMTTVTSQATVWRVAALLRIPNCTRLLSLEPLSGPVNLGLLGTPPREISPQYRLVGDEIAGAFVGGASGPRAPRCDVAWIRSIIRQCREAGVRCFVKQLGAVVTGDPEEFPSAIHDYGDGHRTFRLIDPKGANPDEWPRDLRVREMPEVQS